ncbi:MAG: glycine--tRNA ligase subunit beta [Arenicellales bacterium]|nr:glycine--tRNA ligase subunit beta [Arenicellales bacterium]
MPTKRAANLLIEIGTEELPPKALRTLGDSFSQGCVTALQKVHLLAAGASYRWFATPRRLSVLIKDVSSKQPDQTTERRGPALQAAFDDEGEPTQAALGFAKSCGVDLNGLKRAKTDKGEWLVFRKRQKGKSARSLIPGCIEQSIKQLPIPKRMRWGRFESEFVRPVHWLVILHGTESIKANLLSVRAGTFTMGHRFHCQGPLHLSDADEYEQTLLVQGTVIADFEKRKERIRKQVKTLIRKKDGEPFIDDDLLEQVTGLVEFPQAMLGGFDPIYLDMPAEVLVSVMRDHQKYFHVSARDGRLLPYFITVNNIKSTAPKRVRQGNERVLRARLADAQFFWNTDRKKTLEEHGNRLSEVLFHQRLGSVGDKRQRLEQLARELAPLCNVDRELCVRAAHLAKADLVTDMVGEFPDLQGVMGYYYAKHDNEHKDVAEACSSHYRPKFSGDELPPPGVGQVVALIDRLDSLVGIFATGEEPTGDKDPYGLRRSSLAVLRLLIEGKLDLDLRHLLNEAVQAYRRSPATDLDIGDKTVDRVFGFMMDRLQGYYFEQGFNADEIASVMAGNPTRPCDFDRRLRAVSKFRQLDAAANLAAANKRIRNILKKANREVSTDFDLALAKDPAEQALANKLQALEHTVRAGFDDAQYENGLGQLASLREPVDRFFDEVMVMVEDDSVRENRLALLSKLQDLFLQVADISYLQD